MKDTGLPSRVQLAARRIELMQAFAAGAKWRNTVTAAGHVDRMVASLEIMKAAEDWVAGRINAGAGPKRMALKVTWDDQGNGLEAEVAAPTTSDEYDLLAAELIRAMREALAQHGWLK